MSAKAFWKKYSISNMPKESDKAPEDSHERSGADTPEGYGGGIPSVRTSAGPDRFLQPQKVHVGNPPESGEVKLPKRGY